MRIVHCLGAAALILAGCTTVSTDAPAGGTMPGTGRTTYAGYRDCVYPEGPFDLAQLTGFVRENRGQ